MKTVQKELEKCSVAELDAFARNILNVEGIPEKANQRQMIALIKRAGWTQATIPVFEVPPQRPSSGSRPMGAAAREASRVEREDPNNGKMRVYYRILIPMEDKPGGEEPVPLSVNGVAMYVPRGEPCEVPEEYVEVLEHAIMFRYEEYTSGIGGLGRPTEVLATPFSFA